MPSITAARIKEFGSLEVGTVEKPVPGPKDVLVKVASCSLVPNTANIVNGKMEEPFVIAMAPMVFGLDVAGTIEEVGEHVLNLKVGDRVYVNPWLICGTCHFCKIGDTENCDGGCLRGYFAIGEKAAKALKRYPVGGLSEYVCSPDSNISVIPPSISFETASRFGYIGTSFGALKKANVGPASTVVINGVTGTLGYAAVAIALGLGAVKILGVGRNPDRLKDVEKMSEKRVKVASSEDGTDLTKWVKEETGGIGPDVLIDCLGVGGDAKITMALIKAVKRGGKAILVAGGGDGDIVQSYLEAMMNSISIVGSMWFTPGQCDDLVALVDAGVIDLDFLQHKRYSLEDVNEAIKFVGDRPGGAVNVVVMPGFKEKS